MKKWIAALLALVMLSQALPWTAFAATGDVITDAELKRALSIAGFGSNPAAAAGSSGRMTRVRCNSKPGRAAIMRA